MYLGAAICMWFLRDWKIKQIEQIAAEQAKRPVEPVEPVEPMDDQTASFAVKRSKSSVLKRFFTGKRV